MNVKLDCYGKIPTRAHKTDAGLDLYSPFGVTIKPRSSVSIKTGVHVELPKGTAGLLVSKSGMNVIHGITSTGLIDQGYTGEIVVKLYNNTSLPYNVKVGDKISQLVIIPVMYEDVKLVDDINGGERGDNGFGSTGR